MIVYFVEYDRANYTWYYLRVISEHGDQNQQVCENNDDQNDDQAGTDIPQNSNCAELGEGSGVYAYTTQFEQDYSYDIYTSEFQNCSNATKFVNETGPKCFSAFSGNGSLLLEYQNYSTINMVYRFSYKFSENLKECTFKETDQRIVVVDNQCTGITKANSDTVIAYTKASTVNNNNNNSATFSTFANYNFIAAISFIAALLVMG